MLIHGHFTVLHTLKSEVFRVVSAAVLFLIRRHWCTRGDLSVDCYTAVTISGDLLRTTHRVINYCVLIYSVDIFTSLYCTSYVEKWGFQGGFSRCLIFNKTTLVHERRLISRLLHSGYNQWRPTSGDLLRTTHRATSYCVLIYSVDIFSAGTTYEQTFQEETTTISWWKYVERYSPPTDELQGHVDFTFPSTSVPGSEKSTQRTFIP